MKNAKYASCFLNQKNIMFIGVMRYMRERLFSFFFFFLENNIYKINFIFIRVFCWLKIVFRWLIFFFYVTIHWKMWKIIFIESFPAKQTECKLRNKSTSVKFQWCCKQRMSSHTNIFISWFANLSSAIYKWQTGFLGLIWFLVAETLAMTMFLLK